MTDWCMVQNHVGDILRTFVVSASAGCATAFIYWSLVMRRWRRIRDEAQRAIWELREAEERARLASIR